MGYPGTYRTKSLFPTWCFKGTFLDSQLPEFPMWNLSLIYWKSIKLGRIGKFVIVTRYHL